MPQSKASRTIRRCQMLQPQAIRFAVDPRDVPTVKAARRLHLTEAQFLKIIERLIARGFPRPDSTTGMYDLRAIDHWMDRRHAADFSLAFTDTGRTFDATKARRQP